MQVYHETENYSENLNERNRVAQAAWRKLCARDGDALIDFRQWRKTYPGIVPEPFNTGNENKDRRYNRSQARDAIYGKKRGGVRSGSFVGRCRVLTDELLQQKVIALDIKGLRHLEFDPSVQFDAEKIAQIEKVLRKRLPNLCCVFVHYGLVEEKNHVHVLCRSSDTALGVSRPAIPDNELETVVAYLMRKPDFTEKVAVAYIEAKRASRKRSLPSRQFHIGCAPRNVRIGLEAIQSVLGTLTARRPFIDRQRQGEKLTNAPVLTAEPKLLIHATLPLLRDATPHCLELVGRLHQAWIQGTYEGMPAKVGAAKTNNLAHALKGYFVRKWLAPGEVDDLEQLALALDLQVIELAPKTDANYPFVTRRNIGVTVIAS